MVFGIATTGTPALMQMGAIAQRVVTADRDQAVDAEEVEVLQHLVGNVVDVVLILVLQMRRHDFFRQGLGRVRELCKNVPPVRPALSTRSSVRSRTAALLSASLSGTMSTRPPQPLRIPMTR